MEATKIHFKHDAGIFQKERPVRQTQRSLHDCVHYTPHIAEKHQTWTPTWRPQQPSVGVTLKLPRNTSKPALSVPPQAVEACCPATKSFYPASRGPLLRPREARCRIQHSDRGWSWPPPSGGDHCSCPLGERKRRSQGGPPASGGHYAGPHLFGRRWRRRSIQPRHQLIPHRG